MIKKKEKDIPQIRRGYKYRLQTTKNHREYLGKIMSACDELYNRVLRLQIDTYKGYQKYVEEFGADAAKTNDIPKKFGVVDTLNMITIWKREEEIFKHVPTVALQQTLIDLERAYNNFFREGASRFPSFRKDKNRSSFRVVPITTRINENAYPLVVVKDGKTVTNQARGAVNIPKLGWVYYSKSRPLDGTPKNMTISREGDKFFVSIQTEKDEELDTPNLSAPKEIAIDFGLSPFITLSNGESFNALSPYVKQQEKITYLTHKLRMAQIHGTNYKKRLLKLEKEHIDIKNQRGDWIHQLTTNIANRFDVVYIPDIKITTLTKKGKSFDPFKNKKMIEKIEANLSKLKNPDSKGYLKMKAKLEGLRANDELYANKKDSREFNKKILDCGWEKFTRLLSYKLEERKAKLYKVEVTKEIKKYDPNSPESILLLEESSVGNANILLTLGKEQYK